MKNVTIILLNWNGGQDTIQCLESLLRSTYPHFRIVVCDNNSTDGSMEKIKAWACGHAVSPETQTQGLHPQLHPLVLPPVGKPVPFIELNRDAAEKGSAESKLVLIQNGSNAGFAAGNNVGIRYALNRDNDFIWLLNNDTVVEKNTLEKLTAFMNAHPEIGLAGNAVYTTEHPEKLQTLGGGKITPLFGTDRFVRSGEAVGFIAGTSLFMRKETPEFIGLLDEGFFFYWEDADFSRRAKNAGLTLGVCADAVIYHKFSASVGAQSLKSDLFKIASMKRYFKKHSKFWFVPLCVNFGGMVIKRILRGQFERLFPIWREILK